MFHLKDYLITVGYVTSVRSAFRTSISLRHLRSDRHLALASILSAPKYKFTTSFEHSLSTSMNRDTLVHRKSTIHLLLYLYYQRVSTGRV